MRDRIKKLRKALDITQRSFAERIGMKPNTIATYEMGRATPSDPAIKSICREFNVSETWLRTGDGEMFNQPQGRREEIQRMVERMMEGRKAEFKYRLISVLDTLDENQWEVLEGYLKKILDTRTEVPAFAPALVPATEEAERDQLEQEADEFAALAREQFLFEKRQELQASSVKKSGGRLA